MDNKTTVLELLSSGATIESSEKALQVSSVNKNWIQDIGLGDLLRCGAIVTMASGFGLLGIDDQILIFEDYLGQYEILSNYNSDTKGLLKALEHLDFYCKSSEAVA
jgi:hypothetical protein